MEILQHDIALRKIERMSIELAERNLKTEELHFIGILEHGFSIAEKVVAGLKKYFPGNITLASLQMDKKNPGEISISGNENYEGKTIVLIDDVSNTGKVLSYALVPLLQMKPASVQTLVLLARTYKKFPIHIDHVGLSVSTRPDEYIYVDVKDGNISARIE